MAVVQYSVGGIEEALLEFSKALTNGEKYVLGSGTQSRTGRKLSFQMDEGVPEEVTIEDLIADLGVSSKGELTPIYIPQLDLEDPNEDKGSKKGIFNFWSK